LARDRDVSSGWEAAVGAGDWQRRTGEGQSRLVSLVRPAASLLMRSVPQVHPQHGAWRTLTTIGEAYRAGQAATLERGIDGMVEKLTVEHWSIPAMKAVVAQFELCKSSVIIANAPR